MTYYKSEDYINRVFEFGYYYSLKNNPEAKEVTHFKFANDCAVKAEKRVNTFYKGTSKYMPHQGQQEMNRRSKQI